MDTGNVTNPPAQQTANPTTTTTTTKITIKKIVPPPPLPDVTVNKVPLKDVLLRQLQSSYTELQNLGEVYVFSL